MRKKVKMMLVFGLVSGGLLFPRLSLGRGYFSQNLEINFGTTRIGVDESRAEPIETVETTDETTEITETTKTTEISWQESELKESEIKEIEGSTNESDVMAETIETETVSSD
ncbi:hypothetical protein ACWN8P_00790 [Vagococcus salmoninarum]|uniref:Uncharacterized protein n=1 Tax=Vagococcus salmoninarum TaxID=2739 RepID=A0A429ZVR6_9ENTE|nr:hypothetical protein [Vagococcus salmoninarum]RST97854.1 hypothetical protein CBF35_00750 [Vagococcus salmoninarum]